MILVQPAYLPSVNYFKDFNDNDLVYDINLKLDESDYFDETCMSNENGVFKVKVPTTNKNKSNFQRDIKIDYRTNWIKVTIIHFSQLMVNFLLYILFGPNFKCPEN